MKAITVCQPYAHLIANGEKFVENRTWDTNHRGWVGIHAGLSKKFMAEGDEALYPGLVFGAVVAAAYLASCVRIDELPAFVESHPQFGWVPHHEHAEGPVCWIFRLIYRIDPPVYVKGARGLYTMPREVMGQVRDQAVRPPIEMPQIKEVQGD